ncbi:unnamed protein product [Malus baccata var. baccata]
MLTHERWFKSLLEIARGLHCVRGPCMFYYGRIYSFGNWRKEVEQTICMAEADFILSQICSAHKWFSIYVKGVREGKYANAVSEMIPLQSSVLTFVVLRSVWMFHDFEGSPIPVWMFHYTMCLYASSLECI